MTIIEAIRSILLGNTSVFSVVSTEIYPMHAPIGSKMPSLSILLVSGSHVDAHDGLAGVVNSRIQVTCMSKDHAEAESLASLVVSGLYGFSGNVTSGDNGTLTIQGVSTPTVRSTYDPTDEIYLYFVTFLVTYEELL